jgi:glutathione S-transferase
MPEILQLYHNNMSTCAQKVRLVLREKGLHAEEIHVDLRAGDQNRPEYLALNPNGVVPTLVDRGNVIIESTIICEYLEDAWSALPLRPADPLARARMRAWTQQPDAGFHQAVGISCVSIAFRHQHLARGPEHVARYLAERPDPVQRERMRQMFERGVDAPGVGAALRRYARFVHDMARQLRCSPWLAGAEFSLADAMAVPYVVRLEHLDMSWWWTDAARGCVEVGAWLARCKERPSYAAIADYLDAKYLELMHRTGNEARGRVLAELELRTG